MYVIFEDGDAPWHRTFELKTAIKLQEPFMCLVQTRFGSPAACAVRPPCWAHTRLAAPGYRPFSSFEKAATRCFLPVLLVSLIRLTLLLQVCSTNLSGCAVGACGRPLTITACLFVGTPVAWPSTQGGSRLGA